MNNVSAKISFLICIALIVVFSGCAHFKNSEKASSASAKPPAADGKYAKEIVALHDVVRQDSQSSKAKAAHLKLAKLYSAHNNRWRNYGKALEHLEAYTKLKDSDVDEEILRWMAAFREIVRLSKEVDAQKKVVDAQKQQISEIKNQLQKSKKTERALSRTNRKLTREEIKLREQNRSLEKSNQKLQQTIEMLTSLDQRVEEKRRNFNN